jgi:hypothetical protein
MAYLSAKGEGIVKKNIQNLMIALALSVASLPVMAQAATPTSFAPVLTTEDAPLRFFTNLNTSMLFSSSVKDGKFNMFNDQLNLGLIYNVGMGLDVGFGVHGGIYSPIGIGRDLPTIPSYADQKKLGAMFGADIMVRYLAMITDTFYAGLQAQVGYNYTDRTPGAPDLYYTGLALKKGEVNSFIPVVLGVALGANFGEAAAVYFMPALELGQTSKVDDKGIWKSALGFQMAVGTAVDLGGTKLVLEVKPRMADFDNKYSWGMDATVGAMWDF